MSNKEMQCKVKIGCAYEPKWFERRQTNGWYSGRNPPPDTDAMWLQNALIGKPLRRYTLIRSGGLWMSMTLLGIIIWTTWTMLR